MDDIKQNFEINKYAEQILAKQTEITIQQFSKLIIFNLVGSFSLLFILWEHSNKLYAMLWITTMVVFTGIITPLFLYLDKKTPIEKRYTKPYRRIITWLSLFRGLLWGSTAWLLFIEDSLLYQAILTSFVLGAISIVSMVSTAYRPAFFAFTLTMVPPFIVRFALGPTIDYQVMAVCIGLYLITLTYLNRSINASIKQMLYLQFALEEQKEAAETAKRAQTQFLATASHDLRQPLHAHGLLVTTLKNRIREPESNRILDILESSMHSMQALLNSLLDISKLDAGALRPEMSAFQIQSLLDQLFLDYEPQANAKHTRFAVRSVNATVISDKALLERILRNLIGNAINYTEKGAVLVIGRYRNQKLRIEVRDSGPGIANADQKVIFQEFKQLPLKNKKNRTGLGLGLAIVQRLANLLNHKIELKSAVGCGSTFSIEVPLSHEHIKATTPETRNKDDSNLNGVKILVVDDNPTIRLGMHHILEAWGGDVTVCSSSKEVMTLLKKNNYLPDIAIVDYRLQDETGIELIDKMKAIVKTTIPTIIITGDTSAEKLQNFQNSGHLVLYKPVEPERLHKSIVSLITSKET